MDQILGITQEIQVEQINKSKLASIIRRFPEARILVIGDIILDEYLLAQPERISREAPVLILNYIKSDHALGGAANAAANIAALGAKVTLIGLLGDDAAALQIKRLAEERNVDLVPVIDFTRLSTVKTRIISTSSPNPDSGTVLKQQVLRVDRQCRDNAGVAASKELLDLISDRISEADLILLSDYGSGTLTENNINKVIELANNSEKKVVADSTGDFSKYKGVYSLTPNQPDAESTLGYKIKSENDLLKAGKDLLDAICSKELVLTRGAKGMMFFSKPAVLEAVSIPALNLSEVFDVTGAGDTVAACYSLGLAVAASGLDSAIIGNLAASLVVRKYGTAVTSIQELLDALDNL